MFAVIEEHGDSRAPGAQGQLTDYYTRSCCGKAGWRAGAEAAEDAYVGKQAEILRRERGLSEQAAREQALANLARYRRALDGHG